MRNSIRLKLLALYSIIALTMASVFGGLTYFNVHHATYRAVDARLLEQAEALVAVLNRNEDGKFLIHLSDYQLDVFQRDYSQALYYRIWNEQRVEVDSSHPMYEIPPMFSTNHRSRGNKREIAINGPANSRILVGKSIDLEVQQLKVLAITSSIVGAVVLVAMLGGGWYLTGRALAPIHRITAAAALISESRLSERIDITAMESELSMLSLTINNAFDRLQRAIERQTRFTADASHELRTPLSIAMLHADRALKAPRSGEEYREVLVSVLKAAKRMQGVVEGLLTVARGDAAQSPPAMKLLRLDELVNDTCELHKIAAESKLIDIRLNQIPVSVQGDPLLLSEAIGNLISNAIKFAPIQGYVLIELNQVADRVVLSITDDGPGISVEDLPFVFDRFYRADKARTSGADRGVGLGLAITKSIIESHGGQVGMLSKEGQGATFSITLKGFARQST